MRSRILLGIAVALALGAAVWLLASEPVERPAGEPSDGEPPAATQPEDAPSLLGVSADDAPVPRALRGSGSIEGTVRREGEPIPADVELRHVAAVDAANPFLGGITQGMIERMMDAGISRKPAFARAVAGVDGAFRFDDLAPGVYEVRARAESGATGFTAATLPARGARVEASVEVAGGSESLSGRVLYANGTPFGGIVMGAAGEANPFAAMMGGGGSAQQATTTDEEGRFTLAGLNPGSISISAILPGAFRVMAGSVRIPHAGEYLLTVDAAGVEIKGQVVAADSGLPIGGAAVFGGGGDPGSQFVIRTTTADADGRFTLSLPAGGGGGLFARAPGFAPRTINFRDDARTEVRLELQRFGRIKGHVTTKAGGAPVAGVPVFAIPASRDRGGPMFPSGAVTAASGAYDIEDVAPGDVKLFVLGSGWLSDGMTELSPDGETPYALRLEPGATAELDIAVVPAGRAEGTVKTDAGEPVAGAVVAPIQRGGSNGIMRMLLGVGGAFGAAVSRVDGSFVVETLLPTEEFTLVARAPGLPDATSDPFRVAAGATQRVDITFASPRWIDVLVVGDADRAPVPGASVRLRPTEGGRGVGDVFQATAWVTDAQGRVRVGPLPAGDFGLRVSADGHIAANTPLEDDAGRVVTVALKRGLVIAGRVEAPEGVPVQGARVNVSANARGRWFHRNVRVSADGAFRVDDIEEEGSYRVQGSLRLQEKRYGAEVSAPAGTEDIVLRLERDLEREARQVVVRVLGQDGTPVASGRVRMSEFHADRGSGSHSEELRGRDVRFEFGSEGAELWVEVYGVSEKAGGSVIRGPLERGEDPIEIRLGPGLAIDGRVTGPDGAGVAGVGVGAFAKLERERFSRGREHGRALTDAQGRFEIRGLGQLPYELRFDVRGTYAPVAPVKAAGGTRGVTVKLRAGARATLRVRDGAGEPIAGARISAQPLGGARADEVEATSDARGEAVLRGLDPETAYRLRVHPPSSRPDLLESELDPWGREDVTVTLRAALSIEGRVLDASGRPVPKAHVWAKAVGDEQWSGGVSADEEGRFTVPKLDASREYELKAMLPGSNRLDEMAAQREETSPPTRPGAKGVTLTLDLGAKITVRVRGWKPPEQGSGSWGPQASLREEAERGATVSAQLDAAGEVTFHGLRGGATYALWIGGLPGSRYVHRTGLKASDGTVEVEPRVGGRITGRLVLPPGAKPRGISAGASNGLGMYVNTQVDPETLTFSVEGLPDGTWGVHGFALIGEERWRGDTRAAVGSQVVIELKKEAR